MSREKAGGDSLTLVDHLDEIVVRILGEVRTVVSTYAVCAFLAKSRNCNLTTRPYFN